MPPIRKVQLDKAAWLWAEFEPDPSNISENNIDVAYRGNVPKCKLGTCRRNCRGNPYCLSGLGESKWLNDNLDDGDEEDQDLQIRPPGTFVGLKNLGATCYVNSLVQLLFHNLAFRRALFLWNPLEDSMEVEECKEDNNIKTPHSVIGQLQFLFGLMQFGTRKSIDPLDFIKSLDLEPSLQQDAQEFSKLLFSLLEDSLQQQSNLTVKNLIADYFRGEYSYITRCSKCRNDSISPSMFYELELNVKGHKTLHESISEFLKEEKLDGDNMYFCSYCNEKQEAARFISLRKLPSVLNLQLMRFIYDRQKGHKKKISSSLQFPDTLDMSPYLNLPDSEKKPILYNLTAVLIHKGPSANSGHYVAHICDQTTGTWYKFNDALVEKVEGKQLKLGSEEDDEGDNNKKSKQSRLPKGYLESNNAYMLVYTAQSVQENTQPITESDLRPELLKQIKASNEAFAKLIAETIEEKKLKRESILAYKSEISSILKVMPITTDGVRDWEAIATKWLTQWLINTKSDFKPVDNSPLLCQHGKLHPDLLSCTKYISVPAADAIFNKYGGGPRLPASEAICQECVSAKCRSIKFRAKLLEDAKEISALLKVKEEAKSGYWVGKRSLKNWRKKALSLFEENEGGNCDSVREVEDCPSPASDNEVMESPSQINRCISECEITSVCPNPDSSGDSVLPFKKARLNNSSLHDPEVANNIELKKFHSRLDSLEDTFQRTLNEARTNLFLSCNELSSHFYNKWKKMDSFVRGICETNSNCSPSISKSPEVVSSTNGKISCDLDTSVEINEDTHNGETDIKSKKRKLECQEKEKDGNEDGKNGIKSDEEDADLEEFNSDLICQHGKFTVDESARRVVSDNIWKKLKFYFPDCPEFAVDSKGCSTCQSVANQDQASLDMKREQAVIQKEVFLSLFNGRNRPLCTYGTYRVICVPEFLRPWRKFIRENGRAPPLYSLRNSTLVCQHGLLLYNPGSSEDSTFFCPVTDDEWENLQQFYTVDTEISVTYGQSETDIIETTPALCEECMSARLVSEQEALLQYEKAKLYIRRISTKKDDPESSSEGGPAAKKAAVGGGKSVVTSADSPGTEAIRRSTRHRRTPGEKEVFVASTDSVRELKLKILNVFGVAPFDQHLYTEDGRELEEPTATLSSVNIYPNSVLTLMVDEPTEDSAVIIDGYNPAPEPEAGFKGTALLKR